MSASLQPQTEDPFWCCKLGPQVHHMAPDHILQQQQNQDIINYTMSVLDTILGTAADTQYLMLMIY